MSSTHTSKESDFILDHCLDFGALSFYRSCLLFFSFRCLTSISTLLSQMLRWKRWLWSLSWWYLASVRSVTPFSAVWVWFLHFIVFFMNCFDLRLERRLWLWRILKCGNWYLRRLLLSILLLLLLSWKHETSNYLVEFSNFRWEFVYWLRFIDNRFFLLLRFLNRNLGFGFLHNLFFLWIFNCHIFICYYCSF